MAKKLYKFHWDCGRQGDLEGLFIADEQTVADAIGKEAQFGEALGKHSDVYGELEAGDVEAIELPAEIVDLLADKLGHSISGYNPLDYIYEEE